LKLICEIQYGILSNVIANVCVQLLLLLLLLLLPLHAQAPNG
jgi:hypothetical protein